ncbi:MAG: dihydroneopterin aldolase [Acidimicrobiales bacterium]
MTAGVDEGRPPGRRWAFGDRIELRDLRVLGVHGVLAEERQRAQPFSVDLDVWLDTGPAGATDDLAATVDYAAVAALAHDAVANGSFALLEAVADAVARAVLDHDERVGAVAATVRKLRPPVPLDLGSVGVRVVRRRPPATGSGPPTAT